MSSVTFPCSSRMVCRSLPPSSVMSELNSVGDSRPSVTVPRVASVPLPLARKLAMPLASPLPVMS